MSERDADGYWTGKGGHLWKTDRGKGSACARPGCGLYYARWSGDHCPEAPDCKVTYNGVQCGQEHGHEGPHSAIAEWS
ncbi:hypothetical protein ACFHW2_12020 [Actinomadura sp. LOL_016]|uniref:hypothetical protein n=1 Tax=unclassified Actinomadura TaxID=2626254 RepID=UPI003A808F44